MLSGDADAGASEERSFDSFKLLRVTKDSRQFLFMRDLSIDIDCIGN